MKSRVVGLRSGILFFIVWSFSWSPLWWVYSPQNSRLEPELSETGTRGIYSILQVQKCKMPEKFIECFPELLSRANNYISTRSSSISKNSPEPICCSLQSSPLVTNLSLQNVSISKKTLLIKCIEPNSIQSGHRSNLFVFVL